MKRLVIILCAPLLLLIFASPAVAASPHFKHGGEPTCTISSTSAGSASTRCTASLSGLGGGDLLINLTVSGFAVYQCQNGGGNTAAGQNKVLEGPVTAPTTIPANQIKNGNVTFTTNAAVLSADATVTAAKAGCPNSNWLGVNPVLTVTNIELIIAQGGVQLFDCTASDPNGLTGTVTLSC